MHGQAAPWIIGVCMGRGDREGERLSTSQRHTAASCEGTLLHRAKAHCCIVRRHTAAL
jgi:hypothetical protein